MWFFSRLFRTAASNPIEARFNGITRYQMMIYALVFFSKVPALWHILNLMLLNPPMTYICLDTFMKDPDPVTVANTSGLREDKLLRAPYSSPINACPCEKPIWDKRVFEETAQTKFGLICDKKKQVSLSETCFYFGMLIGAFLFGLLSDRFGRVMMFSVSFLVTGLAGVAVSQSPNMPAFFAFRFFEGLGAGGTIVTSFVLLIEFTGSRYRETICALYHIPINISHMAISGVSYGLRDAFVFELAISIPVFIFIFAVFLFYESPLWLLTNKYTDRTVKAMEAIGKFNNKPDTTIRSDIAAYYASLGAGQKKIQLYHIFKFKKLTINLLCMCYMYVVCGMGYYGVSQYISKMSGDIHKNIAISAALVMPGTIASAVLLNKIGRKPFLISTNLVSGVFMLITVIIPQSYEPAWLKVIFACISNCFFFMSFIVVFLYGVELFPTQIRNSALGFLSLLSRAGMMTAPQINVLSPTVAGYVFAGLALFGSGLTCFLPETKNRQLPSTLEEAEIKS